MSQFDQFHGQVLGMTSWYSPLCSHTAFLCCLDLGTMWIHLALSPVHDLHGLCHGSGSQSPASHHKGPGSITDQYMWDL